MAITPENYQSGMPPRPGGYEFELNSVPYLGSLGRLSQPALRRFGLPLLIRDETLWLGNGMSFVEDVDHVEARTAESLDAVTGSAEAEQTLAVAGLLVGAALPKRGKLFFHAGSVASAPDIFLDAETDEYVEREVLTFQSRSAQLSLMTVEGRGGDLTPHNLLTTFAVTSSWAGAGLLTKDGFFVQQRTAESDSNGDDCFVRLKGYNSAAGATDIVPPGFAVAERRSGDANRSAIVNLVQQGASSALLRLYEHQHRLPKYIRQRLLDCLVAEPTAAADKVREDLSLRPKLSCADGKRREPMTIQQTMLDAVLFLNKIMPLPSDELLAVQWWQTLLNVMRHSRPLKGEIDAAARLMHWAYRMKFLSRLKQNKRPLLEWSADNPYLNNRSLSLDMIRPIDPMRSFAEMTRRQITPKDDVSPLRTQAPPGRASARGAVIKAAAKNPRKAARIKGIKWLGIQTTEAPFFSLDTHTSEVPSKLRGILE